MYSAKRLIAYLTVIIPLVILHLSLSANTDSLSTYRLVEGPKLTVKNGLSNRKVNAITQDKLGFLWFATDYGLNRYDGHQIEFFTVQKDSLPSNRITHILVDAHGIFWLLEVNMFFDTWGEILHIAWFDPQSRKKIHPQQMFKSALPFEWKEVRHFFRGPDGILYFCTTHNTYGKYKQERTFERWHLPEGFFPIQLSEKGGVWGQIGQELQLIDENQNISIRVELDTAYSAQKIVEGLGTDVFYKAYRISKFPFPAKAGPVVWAKTSGASLSKDMQVLVKSRPNNIHMLSDEDPQVYWVLKDEIQLFNAKEEPLLFLEEQMERVRSHYLDNYYLDNNDILWYQNKEGVASLKLEPKLFRTYLGETLPNGRYYNIKGILSNAKQPLVGTNWRNQLVDIKTGQSSVFEYPSRGRAIWSFIPLLGEDKYTIQAVHYSLFTLETQNWKVLAEYTLPEVNKRGMKARPFSTFRSSSGRLWIKKKHFLLYKEKEEQASLQIFDQYNEFEELKEEPLNHFYENEDGIWMASNRGIFLLDEEKGITKRIHTGFQSEPQLPSNSINFIKADTGSRWWLATADLGLVNWDYKNGEWYNISLEDGFPNNNISSIIEDDFGVFWLPSQFGLIRFDPSDNSFQSFFEEDGLVFNVFNKNAYFADDSDHIYMGTPRGIVALEPSRFVKPEQYQVVLSLSKAKIFDKDGNFIRALPANNNAQQKIHMSSREKTIDLYLALQDYFYSDGISYEYRNTKANDDWLRIEGNRLRLGSLGYGKKQFQIRAQGRDGRFAQQMIDLNLQIRTPIYLRWWFLILLVLLLAASIFFFIKWRTLQLEKQQQKLEEEIAKRMEEIKENRKIIDRQAVALQAVDLQFVDKIELLIQQNLSNPNFRIEDLAKASGYSRSHLYRKLKEAVIPLPNASGKPA